MAIDAACVRLPELFPVLIELVDDSIDGGKINWSFSVLSMDLEHGLGGDVKVALWSTNDYPAW